MLAHLPAHNVAVLTGKRFFPELISGPFHHGLVIVFSMAIALLVIAAGVSLLRGEPLRARGAGGERGGRQHLRGRAGGHRPVTDRPAAPGDARTWRAAARAGVCHPPEVASPV